jgi:hypothetical protein
MLSSGHDLETCAWRRALPDDERASPGSVSALVVRRRSVVAFTSAATRRLYGVAVQKSSPRLALTPSEAAQALGCSRDFFLSVLQV